MHHHTINTLDPESIGLIEGMIGEYMELFTSKQFNFCADETFDLGKGKSKAAVEEKGRGRIYIDYVKKLADFVISKGRRPMFWGDVILGFPELLKDLPEEIICLNWDICGTSGKRRRCGCTTRAQPSIAAPAAAHGTS